MKIEKISIEKLLNCMQDITIPFYQRNYSWSEREVRKLINDIKNNKNNEYFLGTIVLENNSFTKAKIIDGQQRISSLFLILKAIYENKFLDSQKKENIKKILDLVNFKSFNNCDDCILNYLLKEKNTKLTDEHLKSNYYKNLNIIRKYFNAYETKINDFFDKFNKIIFGLIEIDNDIDEHLLFSQINSTGKKLSAFDLFKNHLFSVLFINENEFYLEQKLDLLDYVTNYKGKDKDEIVSDILRRYLSYKTGNLANKETDKIYDCYLEFYQKNNDPKYIFDSFYQFALCYKFLKQNMWQKYSFKQELNMIIDSINTYANILIDVILNNCTINDKQIEINKIQEQNIKQAFKIIEIYKVRRMFCGMNEKNITRFIPKITKNIDNLTSAEKLYWYLSIEPNMLKKLPTYRMPNESEFAVCFQENNIYLQSSKFVKQLLIRIGEFDNKTKLEFDNFTVEHIMPQNLEKWIEDGFDDDNQEVEKFMHTIGNLTITPYNSEYSNSTFNIKKQKMSEYESFSLNNKIFQESEWNTDSIKKRTNDLYEIILKIYDIENIKKSTENKIKENHLNQIFIDNSLSEKEIEIFNKLKSYFNKIDQININDINQIIYSYYIECLSYQKCESKIFGMNFKGFFAESIINFLKLPKKQKNIEIKNIDQIKSFCDEFDNRVNIIFKVHQNFKKGFSI